MKKITNYTDRDTQNFSQETKHPLNKADILENTVYTSGRRAPSRATAKYFSLVHSMVALSQWISMEHI
jgi:hypothetical protein